MFYSEYCAIFKSTYFEVHLQTAASETEKNVFMKLRKIKNYSYRALIFHSKQVFSTSASVSIRVPKVPFHVFDKLKNKIRNSILRFCFYLNAKNEIQVIDYHFHA